MNRELSDEPRPDGHERYSEGVVVASGAVVGAAVAYLVLTPKGRRLCDAIVDALDTFSTEWSRMCRATTRAKSAAEEGWEALETGARPIGETRL